MSHDTMFGAILAATWVNVALLMLEALQVLECRRTKSNPMSRKLLVLWCFAIDLVCTSVNCACVYLYTVTHWGDVPYSMNQQWPMSVQVVCTGAVAFSVQLFLIMRYYLLSRNLYISASLALLSLASLAGAIASSVVMAVHSSYTERSYVTAPSLVWLAASVGADWMIAGMLVWELRRRRARTGMAVTDGILRTLISNAIKTGSVTSFLATMSPITYFAVPESNVPVAIGFILGRVYTLTMLYNINSSAGLTSKSRHRQHFDLPKHAHAHAHSLAAGHEHQHGHGHGHDHGVEHGANGDERIREEEAGMFTTLGLSRDSADGYEGQETSRMFGATTGGTTTRQYRDEERG